MRERDDRTGNRGEHVLNQRADVRMRTRRCPQEGVKVGLQLRERDDRTGNRGEHVLNQRADMQRAGRPHRNRGDSPEPATALGAADDRHRREPAPPPDQGPRRPDQEPAPTGSGAGAATGSGTAATGSGAGADRIRDRGDRIRNRGDRSRTARPDQEPAPPPDQEPAPPPDAGDRRRRPDREPRRRCPSRSSRPWCPCRQARYSGYSRRWKGWPEASVPPGSLLGLFAPVEGWPEASVPPLPLPCWPERWLRAGCPSVPWCRAGLSVGCRCRAGPKRAPCRCRAGLKRWCRHRRAQRNRWNRDRQRRPRPRHPSAGPLRARKHLQRSANATDAPSCSPPATDGSPGSPNVCHIVA